MKKFSPATRKPTKEEEHWILNEHGIFDIHFTNLKNQPEVHTAVLYDIERPEEIEDYFFFGYGGVGVLNKIEKIG